MTTNFLLKDFILSILWCARSAAVGERLAWHNGSGPATLDWAHSTDRRRPGETSITHLPGETSITHLPGETTITHLPGETEGTWDTWVKSRLAD